MKIYIWIYTIMIIIGDRAYYRGANAIYQTYKYSMLELSFYWLEVVGKCKPVMVSAKWSIKSLQIYINLIPIFYIMLRWCLSDNTKYDQSWVTALLSKVPTHYNIQEINTKTQGSTYLKYVIFGDSLVSGMFTCLQYPKDNMIICSYHLHNI